MIPCFTHEGMKNMVGWYVGEVIFAKIAAETAAEDARRAEPGYVPEPFVWGVNPAKTKKSDSEIFTDYCAGIRARKAEKETVR